MYAETTSKYRTSTGQHGQVLRIKLGGTRNQQGCTTAFNKKKQKFTNNLEFSYSRFFFTVLKRHVFSSIYLRFLCIKKETNRQRHKPQEGTVTVGRHVNIRFLFFCQCFLDFMPEAMTLKGFFSCIFLGGSYKNDTPLYKI